MNDHAATTAARRHHRVQRTRRALPGQLFCRTQIPVCLCFCEKNQNADAKVNLSTRSEIWKN